jgi:hypothetical protein
MPEGLTEHAAINREEWAKEAANYIAGAERNWAAEEITWIAEAARLLRPGGELVFLVNGTLLMLTTPDLDPVVPAGTELLRPYLGMRRFEWESEASIDVHLGYGDLWKARKPG